MSQTAPSEDELEPLVAKIYLVPATAARDMLQILQNWVTASGNVSSALNSAVNEPQTKAQVLILIQDRSNTPDPIEALCLTSGEHPRRIAHHLNEKLAGDDCGPLRNLLDEMSRGGQLQELRLATGDPTQGRSLYKFMRAVGRKLYGRPPLPEDEEMRTFFRRTVVGSIAESIAQEQD